jgi:branched-chain amino acid transport system permease protein
MSTTAMGGVRLSVWVEILKEAAFAAVIALALTVTLIGMNTVSENSKLVIEYRWVEVGWATLLVFIGRIGLSLIGHGVTIPAAIVSAAVAVIGYFVPAPELVRVIMMLGGVVIALRAVAAYSKQGKPPTDAPPVMDQVAAYVSRSARVFGPIALVVVIALPLIWPSRYVIDVMTLVFTYIMLGWGLNIVVGLAGLLDLGFVAFFAVGAYSYALLGTQGWSFWACLPVAGLLSACSGLLLGFPVLRLRGDYFAIVTLGFGEIIRIVLINWADFTGGPNGIGNIPRPSFFGLAEFTDAPEPGVTAFNDLFGIAFDPNHRVFFLYYLIVALALMVHMVSVRLRRLPLGRSWEALREDDIACQSLGINRRNIKLAAFMISATFGGLAGAFFATRQGFVSPESFTFIESAVILAIVVLGGLGSQVGVVLATILIIGLPEVFRDLDQYRMIVFGGAMVAIMLWRPRGLLAHREPSLLLHGASGWLTRLGKKEARS